MVNQWMCSHDPAFKVDTGLEQGYFAKEHSKCRAAISNTFYRKQVTADFFIATK